MKNKRRILKFGLVTFSLLFTFCSKDDAVDKINSEKSFATSVELVAGGEQTATVGTVLLTPIEVIVKDQNGKGYSGASISFKVIEGSLSTTSATTDTNGKATVTWTLGTSVGIQTLNVTALKPDGTSSLTGSPLLVTAAGTDNNNNFEVSTLAGSTFGFANGVGSAAKFHGPSGVTVDDLGNIYVADNTNHKIRKITPTGEVSTLAGSVLGYQDDSVVDITTSSAKFYFPSGVAVDASGNVYVADGNNHKIRKITSSGEVTTLAGSSVGFSDGIGNEAKFSYPIDVAVDISGNVYVADDINYKVRKVTPEGKVSTIAGSTDGFADGIGSNAKFSDVNGIAVDLSGNVYVADSRNYKIRKITPEGVVSTLAGSTRGYEDGSGSNAKFSSPVDVTVDNLGNVYVADSGNDNIRKITPNGVVSTIAGSTEGFADGIGIAAKFRDPIGIVVDPSGNIYIADSNNHKIRKITQE